MAWLDAIQRSLGEPVLAFAVQHWVFLLVVVIVAGAWLFGCLSDETSGEMTLGPGVDGDSDAGGRDLGGH
jgi:hypothetical protein